MKTRTVESDFIGGLGALTTKEEEALAAFFAKRKTKLGKRKLKREQPEKEKKGLSKSEV